METGKVAFTKVVIFSEKEKLWSVCTFILPKDIASHRDQLLTAPLFPTYMDKVKLSIVIFFEKEKF